MSKPRSGLGNPCCSILCNAGEGPGRGGWCLVAPCRRQPTLGCHACSWYSHCIPGASAMLAYSITQCWIVGRQPGLSSQATSPTPQSPSPIWRQVVAIRPCHHHCIPVLSVVVVLLGGTKPPLHRNQANDTEAAMATLDISFLPAQAQDLQTLLVEGKGILQRMVHGPCIPTTVAVPRVALGEITCGC